MARNKKQKGKDQGKWHEGIKPETKQSVFAIFAFAIGILLTLAAFGRAGFVGDNLQKLFELLFGRAFFLVPLVFFIGGLSFLFSLRRHFVTATVIGAALFLLSSLGIINIIFENNAAGYLGLGASYPFLKLFDFWAALIILFAIALAGILVMTNLPLPFFGNKDKKLAEREEPTQAGKKETPIIQAQEIPRPMPLPVAAPLPISKPDEEFSSISLKTKKARNVGASSRALPPLDLLEDDRGVPSSGDLKANANIIKRTLQTFGIEVEMMEVNVGPSVTQYTLKPAEGMKISRITGLQNDLALALAASSIRIEAPIPGRSLVGVEVPNRSISLVGLRSLLSTDEYQKSERPLIFALGRDVSGKPLYADLGKMPHLLIAGATGAGKSVAIHSFMMSLLYRNTPEFLRFILVDPKRVELSSYSKLPHLLTPAINDAKKTILSLRWATKEMERRYEVLSQNGVRDIGSYHANVLSKDKEAETLPYIVIVVDELADIMATYPRELEASIVRLAQMSRAVGIHLVLSTQRPSVEVITGLIKANITSRIAFQVASQIDSRTILDTSGAEKLLGNGDMLFLAGDVAKPKRIQGAFVSEKEVKRVAAWIVEHGEGAEFNTEAILDTGPSANGISASSNGKASLELDGDLGNEEDEELFEQARQIAVEAGKISTSYLQRRLKLGYARAARIIDMLEDRGVVGPQDGAKPREVLIKKDESDDGGGAKADKKSSGEFYESF